jgi:hypothetical protein
MGIVGREFERVCEATVLRMIDIVVRASDRFVYSRTHSNKIQEMVDECGGPSVPGKTAFVGPTPDERRIEEHMRQSLGISKRKR